MNDTCIGIKEVARLAGVSIGTVDRVIHNRTGVSKKTHDHVQTILKSSGYKKNNVASRLKLANSQIIKLAVLIPEEALQKNHYWSLVLHGIQKANDELKELGITFNLLPFKLSNPLSYSNNFNSIFDQECHGIITVPVFNDAYKELNQIARQKQIPIVSIDIKPKEEHTSDFYIVQDAFKSGTVAGRILNQSIGQKGHFLVINTTNSNTVQQNMKDREDGFRHFFRHQYDGSEENITTVFCESNELQKVKETLVELAKKNKPLGIFITNSKAYLIPSLVEEITFEKCTIVGYDLNVQNLELLKENKLDFIINQKPEFQGYSAVKGLFKHLTEGEDHELKTIIPVEILIKENLEI